MSKDIIQQATESNKIQPQNRTTLRDEFRKALSLEGKSKRTIEAYVDAITRFVVFSNGLYPIKATVNDIRAFLFHLKEERKLAARSYNQILYGLKSFFSIFMPDVPIMDSFCRLKVKDGEYIFITRHEFDAMMRHTTNIKHQAIISVLYGTGIRVSECVGLTFGDLDRKEGLVSRRSSSLKLELLKF